MMKSPLCSKVFILSISLIFSGLSVAAAQQHDLLLIGGNIINVQNGEITERGMIAIDDNKISWIGTQQQSRQHQSKRQINVAGKYIIPGLWDMHVHIEGKDLVADNKALLPLFIAYGITTVRDAASDLGEQVLAWRQEINDGKLFGPRIFTAGRKLEGIDSIWQGDLEIGNEQELEQMLDKLDQYKVDFVKITENTLLGPLFLTSVTKAHERGYIVSGHIPYDLAISQLAQAGLSSIEHASYLLRLGNDERKIVSQIRDKTLSKQQASAYYVENFDQQQAIQGYRSLAKSGVAVTPTLIGGKQLAYLDQNNHMNDPFHQYLTQRFMSKYQWRIDRMAKETPAAQQRRKDRYQLVASQLPYIQQAGVMILAGSDSAALNTFVYPALALHQELELFQKAGLTPLQILQSATINGAKFLAQQSSLATLEQGKIADIVVLNKNPLADISATQNIHAVIKDGHYYDRHALDLILQQAKQTRIELDKSRH